MTFFHMSLALFVTSIFCLNGIFIAMHFFRDEKDVVKLIFGLCIGLVLMMWLPVPFSLIIGFNILSQFLALSCATILGLMFFHFSNSKSLDLKNILQERFLIFTTLPLFILTVYLLYTHILKPNEYGGLNSGQSTFGDLPLHLGLVTSITNQQYFPPKYSILANSVLVGYPFLCDSISATLYSMGIGLRSSFIAPMIVALITVFCGTFLFFEKWLDSSKKASLATILFFIGGGFGFVYFIDLSTVNPNNFNSIFTDFYTTPTNFADKNILWVNVIADLLIPQRATLFGLAIAIPCIYILYSLVFENKIKYFLPLALLVGSLPLIHTHSFLAIGILSTVYFIFHVYITAHKKWILRTLSNLNKNTYNTVKYMFFYAVIALTLALPQLLIFTFNQATVGDNFLRFHFNWINDKDNYFWFYIKNLGFIYILIIPAFINSENNKKIFYLGGLAILFISEFIVFQPNAYDNNKLLIIWFLLSCGLVTNFLAYIFHLLSPLRGIKQCTIILFFIMNLSGLLTLWGEVVSTYEQFDPPNVSAAAFIEKHTDSNALFLTANNHNNSVAALAGRTIFCGTEIYLFYHGINYSDNEHYLFEMYNHPSLELLKSNKIDYVYISDSERNKFSDLDEDFFKDNLELFYRNSSVSIYKVQY